MDLLTCITARSGTAGQHLPGEALFDLPRDPVWCRLDQLPGTPAPGQATLALLPRAMRRVALAGGQFGELFADPADARLDAGCVRLPLLVAAQLLAHAREPSGLLIHGRAGAWLAIDAAELARVVLPMRVLFDPDQPLDSVAGRPAPARPLSPGEAPA